MVDAINRSNPAMMTRHAGVAQQQQETKIRKPQVSILGHAPALPVVAQRKPATFSIPPSIPRPAVKKLLAQYAATSSVHASRKGGIRSGAAKLAGSGSGNLLGEAQSLSDDPYAQFLMLQLAAQEFGGNGGDQQRQQQAFEEAIHYLEMHHGADIRARAHADMAPFPVSDEKPAQQQVEHDRYTALLKSDGSFLAISKQLLTSCDAAGFAASLEWLMRTLASDMQSGWASRDLSYLGVIRDNLGKAMTFKTVLAEAGELLSWLVSMQVVPKGDAVALTKEVVDLSSQRWLPATRVEQLSARFAASLAARSRWWRRLKTFFGTLPMALFADEDSRNQALDTLQTCYDRRAQQEDLDDES